MRKPIALAALALLVTVAGTAAAEETVIQEEDKVVVREKTRLNFGEAELSGELQKPGGDVVMGHKASKFSNLIKPRKSFGAELRDSAEE